ncbi:uncharacterized protein LOC106650895 [Trichogramma pretiosum]|uniref:uncharacterized protein LOC106650895 n=1 Tax=Trichogramma pretiosum TaxID=7493 RepID=UPI0006C9CE83|nr:uncharacterized protein LOC106650895 [Trichogramma pretiosum]
MIRATWTPIAINMASQSSIVLGLTLCAFVTAIAASSSSSSNYQITTEASTTEAASTTITSVKNMSSEHRLAKLVKLFSKPGAFNQIDAIFSEEESEYEINSREQLQAASRFSSQSATTTTKTTTTRCPDGEQGLECRRAEARRSVDCPRGDCFCYNCAKAGPELWVSCCKESLKCCSHLAAACRLCDQPVLYPFCAKSFKKCLNQLNDKKLL